MKEIKIIVRITDEKVDTGIKASGFTDEVSAILEIIGALDNLKQEQLKKLNSKSIREVRDGRI